MERCLSSFLLPVKLSFVLLHSPRAHKSVYEVLKVDTAASARAMLWWAFMAHIEHIKNGRDVATQSSSLKAKWQTLSFLDFFFSGKAFLWCWFDPFFQTACGCLHQGRLVVRGQNREWGNGHRNSDKLLQQQENQNAEWYNRVGRTCYLLDSCRGKLGNLANHPQMEPGMYLTLKIYSNCSAEAGKEIKQTWFDSFKTRQASREFFSLRKEFQAGFRALKLQSFFSPQLSGEENLFEECFSKFAILKLNCSLILYKRSTLHK